jgi:DNA-binding transcriptional LysR family regulator
MIDVRRLRVLCEVARHGSFSAAAESLGYTQPAVSRQIATLEAEVGAILVRRVPQGAVLTDPGRVLVERGEVLLGQLSSLELELQALAGLEGGRLRFGSFASAVASIVPIAIAEFRSRYPNVEISIRMADPIESLPALRAGELDIALSHDPMATIRHHQEDVGLPGAATLPGAARPRSATTSAPEDGVAPAQSDNRLEFSGSPDAFAVHRDVAGLDLVPLFEDPMYVALPQGHPLAGVEPLGLERFADEPWMLATTSTCPDSRLFLRACHAAGFEPQIAFQNDDYPAILGFVAAGVGVALIPDMVARGVRDDVVVRMLDPAPPPRPIMAVLPAGYRSPAASAMLEVLSEVSENWVAQRPALSLA